MLIMENQDLLKLILFSGYKTADGYSYSLGGTDKLTHTRGLELQNSCGDSIITDRWLHFERNLMQKEAEYSHF